MRLAAFRENNWIPEYSTKLRVRDGRRYMLFFRDRVDPILGQDGMVPTIVSENIEVLQVAMREQDPDKNTGYLSSSVDTFNFSDADIEEMPVLPDE